MTIGGTVSAGAKENVVDGNFEPGEGSVPSDTMVEITANAANLRPSISVMFPGST